MNNDVSSFPSTFCSSAVNLNNINRLPTSLDVSSTYITPATHTLWYKGIPPAKPTKVEQVEHVHRLQNHLPVSILEIDSRSVRRKGEFGAQSRPCWFARALGSRPSERRR
jgi:hypothetical protein